MISVSMMKDQNEKNQLIGAVQRALNCHEMDWKELIPAMEQLGKLADHGVNLKQLFDTYQSALRQHLTIDSFAKMDLDITTPVGPQDYFEVECQNHPTVWRTKIYKDVVMFKSNLVWEYSISGVVKTSFDQDNSELFGLWESYQSLSLDKIFKIIHHIHITYGGIL